MTPSRLLSRIWVIRPYISGSQLLEIGKYRVEDRLHLASSCWPPTRAPFFSLFWGVVAIRASAQYLDDQDPAISRVDHAKHVRGAKTRDLSERAHDLPGMSVPCFLTHRRVALRPHIGRGLASTCCPIVPTQHKKSLRFTTPHSNAQNCSSVCMHPSPISFSSSSSSSSPVHSTHSPTYFDIRCQVSGAWAIALLAPVCAPPMDREFS